MLMGLSIVNGTNAGGFSPVAVYYQIISGVLAGEGIMLDAIPMFILTLVGSFLLNLVAFMIFGGPALLRNNRAGQRTAPPTANDDEDEGWQPVQLLTVATMLVVIVAAVGFNQDVGYMAISGAIFLAAFHPEFAEEGMKRIGWGVVLLIGGMVTYVNVLSSAGIIDDIAHRVANLSTPLVAALVLFYISSFITSFASSNAMFVIIAPLSAPLLLGGDVPVLGFAVALVLSVVMTDSCPISTAGALVVANSPEHRQQRMFNSLLKWTAGVFLLVPLVTWMILVVPF